MRTGFDCTWGPLIARLGIKICHIVPKTIFVWYAYPEIKLSPLQKQNAVNCSNNYITMKSLNYISQNNWLLTIYPIDMSTLYPNLLVILNKFSIKYKSLL